MIAGIGCDMVDRRRVEALLKRFGTRFEQRVFTDGERQLAKQKQPLADRYSKYIAAKEATFKALRTPNASGISWRDLEVSYEAHGQPTLKLHGAAQIRARTLCEGRPFHTHLSLSDEPPYALAYVIVETY